MKTGIITAAVLTAVSASVASADLVNVKFIGTGKGTNVKMTYGAKTQDVFAGQLIHQLSNATAPFDVLNGTKITFCTDMLQYVSKNTTQYEFVDVPAMPGAAPMGVEKAAAIHDIFDGAAGVQLTGTVSNDYAAAFQLAVWEIIADYNPTMSFNGVNITGGVFKATKTNGSSLSNGVLNAFNTIMGYIGQVHSHDAQILGITSGSAQDQLVEGRSVPAPGAALLASMGLGLIARRRAR
ncbi:MAG: hypothetical protein AMXMBFR58_12730 [Phycisphaerae bacterium]|nr:hypothetical protein [Phycisphaerales bacterium]MCK6477330.1 hypothetical protein [Phycisphaerales bacterium]